MELSGGQLEALASALRSGFSMSELDQFLLFRLNVHLEDIVGNVGREAAFFAVIQWSVRQGRIFELIRKAKQARPQKQQIQALDPQIDVVADDMTKAAELERLVSPLLGILDAGTWAHRLQMAMGQVCRIVAPVTAGGTGFLLGTDLVLTNFHVLEAVIPKEHGGQATAEPGEVRFSFDDRTIPVGAVAPSLNTVGLAKTGAWLVASSPPTPAEGGPARKSFPTATRLDFALVRLAAKIGMAPRGWVVSPSTGPDGKLPLPRVGQSLLILQHPLGGVMNLAIDSRAVLGLDDDGSRVRYRTNTASGSSGSPCFDIDWNLIALHHGTDPDHSPNHQARYNQGIPFAMIAAEIGQFLPTASKAGGPSKRSGSTKDHKSPSNGGSPKRGPHGDQ